MSRKPRRKACSQISVCFVNEAAYFAGDWGVPNKHSEATQGAGAGIAIFVKNIVIHCLPVLNLPDVLRPKRKNGRFSEFKAGYDYRKTAYVILNVFIWKI